MVNIKDVAKRAGVSTMTVSRVVNNPEAVSIKTRERVQATISELNYIPNQLAKSLVNAESKTIGVLFSNIFNAAYSSIISGIEKRAKELDFNVMITNATDYDSSVRGLDMLVSKMVDGLIILPIEPFGMNSDSQSKQALDEMWRFYDYIKQILADRKLPCVIIDIDIGSNLVEYVCHDFAEAARIGIRYLIGKGFRKIHHISSELKAGLWLDRLAVYEEEMTAAGLESEMAVDYCVNSTEGAFKLVRELLDRGIRPEVFYCANDIIAIGAMQAISAYGLRVPQDISVMGNDGIYVGEMIVPALTTVDINSFEVGTKSMEVCYNIVEHRAKDEKIFVKPALLCRKSVT